MNEEEKKWRAYTLLLEFSKACPWGSKLVWHLLELLFGSVLVLRNLKLPASTFIFLVKLWKEKYKAAHLNLRGLCVVWIEVHRRVPDTCRNVANWLSCYACGITPGSYRMRAWFWCSEIVVPDTTLAVTYEFFSLKGHEISYSCCCCILYFLKRGVKLVSGRGIF